MKLYNLTKIIKCDTKQYNATFTVYVHNPKDSPK